MCETVNFTHIENFFFQQTPLKGLEVHKNDSYSQPRNTPF